ncbi:hypothetical protein SUDANB70_01474 [Streptomyces sp. enrichment culture]
MPPAGPKRSRAQLGAPPGRGIPGDLPCAPAPDGRAGRARSSGAAGVPVRPGPRSRGAAPTYCSPGCEAVASAGRLGRPAGSAIPRRPASAGADPFAERWSSAGAVEGDCCTSGVPLRSGARTRPTQRRAPAGLGRVGVPARVRTPRPSGQRCRPPRVTHGRRQRPPAGGGGTAGRWDGGGDSAGRPGVGARLGGAARRRCPARSPPPYARVGPVGSSDPSDRSSTHPGAHRRQPPGRRAHHRVAATDRTTAPTPHRSSLHTTTTRAVPTPHPSRLVRHPAPAGACVPAALSASTTLPAHRKALRRSHAPRPHVQGC